MKQAYAPALEVSRHTVIEKVRELPLQGVAQVQVGDAVEAGTTVLTAELPGDLTVLRIADRMGFEPEDIAEHIKVSVGQAVKKGDLLCELHTFFGIFSSKLLSPTEGVVEFFTRKNAHLGIRHASKPISVDAYISGKVIAVDEGKRVVVQTAGALLQGVFGVGGERHGRIVVLDAVAADAIVEVADITPKKDALSGAIVFGGSQVSLEALQYLAEAGVVAVVTGSVDAEVLAAYVGREIGVSITGDEDVPATLIVTEGFGRLPMSSRILELAKELEGCDASVNGATQVRAGATRPEVIVANADVVSSTDKPEPKILTPGARIRIIRVPYFGLFGEILELPSELQEIDSGAKVRVVTTRLDDGREVTLPRANVELL